MGRERHDFPPFDREPPRLDGGAAPSSWADGPRKPERDWKRLVLIFGLGALSWVATYVGMLELIEANMGDLPFVHRVIIGFSVAMLMTMIIWLLDQLFKPHPLINKVSYLFGYVFLSVISVGFGFGFYWKVLESRGEASRSAESAVGQVQGSLHAASTRLEQLQATLVQLAQISNEKAVLESTKGTSCPDSKPGDGPRRKLRDEDAQRFNFSSEFVKGRIGAVNADMRALDTDLAKIASNDASTIDVKSGTRNDFMRALSRRLDMTVTGFNAFRTDPQLKQIRNELSDRAERTTFPDNRSGTFSCPDAQLQTALRGAVKAIDQIPELEKPEIAAVEGSEATIEAFRRLTATFYGMLSFKMPPSADELRDLQKKAVQSVENPAGKLQELNGELGGLSRRDYVPLAVAIFVDLCLLLVSMAQKPTSRLSGLMPKMHAAEQGPVIEILSRFKDIHRDEQIRENFEIFRHVVFDMNGDYYVAVPLDAPPRLNPTERENLRIEAQLLANLFASFEKERIFKRTLLPTTASIQKRLKRQGSKFAASEAYRVYKFTNGAWSDIILGAVMGAARRIEKEQGMRPPLQAPAIAAKAAASPDQARANAPASAAANDGPAFTMDAARAALSLRRRSPPPAGPVDPKHAARFGPYAANYPEFPPLDSKAPQSPRVPRPAPPPHPEAEVTVKGAEPIGALPPNPLTHDATTAPAGNSTVIVALPRNNPELTNERPSSLAPAPLKPQASKATGVVDVTLARETATFSVPVCEAYVPASLRAALVEAGLANNPLISPADEVVAAASWETGANREHFVDSTGDDGHFEDFSDGDLALFGRIAPPAAE